MMKYIYLALLAVVTVLHLIASFRDDAKNRAKTKPFLLPLILLYYIAAAPAVNWLLVTALVASWLGDVLLIPKGNKWFIFGGIAFLISHIMFMVTYLVPMGINSIQWYVLLPAAAVYFTVSGFVVKAILNNTPKIMQIPMLLYLFTNSLMNCFALTQLVNKPCLGSAIAYVGAVLFFISDCTLYLVRYHKKQDMVFKRHFTVMLTYILGELLITQGVMMLSQ